MIQLYHVYKSYGPDNQALVDIDYVYLDFADAHLANDISGNFLARLRASAADYSMHIAKALGSLD